MNGSADEGAPTAGDAESRPPSDRGVASTPVSRLLESECLRLLGEASLGGLAFVFDGWPVAVPVNYSLDSRALVFRTDSGAKLEAVARSARVALEVDSFDALYESGWSVLAQGLAEEVGREERARLAATLRLRPWPGGSKSHWVRVPITQVTGRRLPRSWAYPGPISGRG